MNQKNYNKQIPFNFQEELSKLQKQCNHNHIYLRSHQQCGGEAQMCEQRCQKSNHIADKHQQFSKNDIQIIVKARQSHKVQLLNSNLEMLESAYKQQIEKLTKIYQQAKLKIQQICKKDKYSGVISIVQSKRFSKLKCWQVHHLSNMQQNNKQLNKQQTDQIIKKFKTCVNTNYNTNTNANNNAQKIKNKQQQRQNQELIKSRITTALNYVSKQYKYKLQEQRKNHKIKQLQLQQMCNKLQNQIQAMKKQYQKYNDIETKTKNLLNINNTQNSGKKATWQESAQSRREAQLANERRVINQLNNNFLVKINDKISDKINSNTNSAPPSNQKKRQIPKLISELNNFNLDLSTGNITSKAPAKEHKKVTINPGLLDQLKNKLSIRNQTSSTSLFRNQQPKPNIIIQDRSKQTKQTPKMKIPQKSGFNDAMNVVQKSVPYFPKKTQQKPVQTKIGLQIPSPSNFKPIYQQTYSYVQNKPCKQQQPGRQQQQQQFGLQDKQQNNRGLQNKDMQQQQYVPIITDDYQQKSQSNRNRDINININRNQNEQYHYKNRKPKQANQSQNNMQDGNQRQN